MNTERHLATIEQERGLTKAGLDQTRDQLVLLENFVRDVLRKDEDYGVIPGTKGKPSLLKPGAANITAAFNCHAEPVIDSHVLDPTSAFVSYEAHVDLVSNLSGNVMARGFGNCNSYEVKYRYRIARHICPTCEQEAVVKGKAEYGGGWLCFKKAGGCGSKWSDGAQEIEGQKVGKVENENPLELANTIKKMAIKRAEVDAAMRLPGVARFFTQDMEDMALDKGHEHQEEQIVKPSAPTEPPPLPTGPPGPKESQPGASTGDARTAQPKMNSIAFWKAAGGAGEDENSIELKLGKKIPSWLRDNPGKGYEDILKQVLETGGHK